MVVFHNILIVNSLNLAAKLKCKELLAKISPNTNKPAPVAAKPDSPASAVRLKFTT